MVHAWGWTPRVCLSALVTVGLLAVAAPGAAQEAEVRAGNHSVVVEDDVVRLRSGDREVEVSRDWRQPATAARAAEVDRILADLGAVVGEDRLRVDLVGDILFGFGSDTIQPEAAARLAQVAEVIRSRSVGDVLVVGHTDAIGSDAYNAGLSQRRALAVMRWLNQHEGIPAQILVGRGVGAAHPVAPNTRPDGSDDAAGRARNRRVEIQVATREGVQLVPAAVAAGNVGALMAMVPRADQLTPGSGTCSELCEALAGQMSFDAIACIEGAFEELGFDFDADACDDLEEVMAMGAGGATGLCLACVREEGLSDAQCGVVLSSCLR